MGKISKDIQFWLERLYINKEAVFHIYDVHGKLIIAVGAGERKEDPLETDKELYTALRERWKNKRYPVFMMEDNWVIYFAFEDQQNNFYIGGPARTISPEDETARMYDYRRKHNLPKSYVHMPGLSPIGAANLLSMSLAIICGRQIEELELLERNGLSINDEKEIEWNLVKYRFESAEMERIHVNYDYERRMLDAVREGKVEAFDNVSSESMQMVSKVGKLAENEGKQLEYMTAAALTLITRAAIEGGVPSDISYAVSDVYFQRLEQCRDMIDILKMNRDMFRKFAGLVREHKEQKNAGYVEQCKDLVAQSIHKHLTVEEIARQIGINRTYLSARFSEQVGMSISRYSTLVRLKAAENMLKYSDSSIAEIAEYLCFSSQSYFGKVFKEKNGITPAEYRRRNKVLDFTKSKHK